MGRVRGSSDPAGFSAIRDLRNRLASSNPDERRRAAEQLGESRDARAIPALIEASGCGGGERAKHAAVRSLAKIGGPAVPYLLGALQSGYNRFCRASAAQALGLIGDPQAVAALIAALRQDSVDVRLHTAATLG